MGSVEQHDMTIWTVSGVTPILITVLQVVLTSHTDVLMGLSHKEDCMMSQKNVFAGGWLSNVKLIVFHWVTY